MKLIDPDKKYLDGYKQAYIQSLKMIEQKKMKEHDIMFENPDEVDIIGKLYDHRDPSKLKQGYVPSYDYFLVEDDLFLGRISIRLWLNDKLRLFAGNIGYGINPIFWNKGYGNKILELGLKKCKELGLKDKVLITCDDDNIASAKIIEKNGGVLENVIENNVDGEKILTRRYWIEI